MTLLGAPSGTLDSRTSGEEVKVMTNPFDDADYYDCGDPEEFSHDTPEEALTDYFDNVGDPTAAQCEADIRAHSPIEVKAFKRRVVGDDWLLAVAEQDLAEKFYEAWHAEFGDPDGSISDEDSKMFARAIAPILRLFIDARLEVWACEQVAMRSYTANECVAMMRKENPGWFEGQCGCHGAPPQNECKCLCHALPPCLMGDI